MPFRAAAGIREVEDPASNGRDLDALPGIREVEDAKDQTPV